MSKGLQSGLVPGQANNEELSKDDFRLNLLKDVGQGHARDNIDLEGVSSMMAENDNIRNVNDLGLREDYSQEHENYDPTDNSTNQNLEDIMSEDASAVGNIAKAGGKFLGKTALQTAGNMFGMIYGTGAAIANGDFSSFYDNDFTNMIDGLQKDLEGSLRIYKSQDYKDAGFFGKFANPTLFLDETTDALAFTAGAVLAEGLTAGMISGVMAGEFATIGGKFMTNSMKGLRAASKEAKYAKGIEGMATKAASRDAAKLLRQNFVTGSVWEGIVETKSSMATLRKDLENKGFSQEEIEKRIASAEKMSLGANIAIVGASNMIQFSKTFGAPKFLKLNKLGDRIKNVVGKKMTSKGLGTAFVKAGE